MYITLFSTESLMRYNSKLNPYYKRGDPYLCSAKAPVLEGSGSRRLYPLKGTSVDRVYVCLLHVSIVGFFYYSSKTDSWGRSLKVTAPR